MQIAIHLDSSSKVSLQVQIVDRLAALINSGKLKAGATLPSTRELSGQLGVSRNTVSEAYERLVLEGYITTARARGTFVRATVIDDGMSAEALASLDTPTIATNLPLHTRVADCPASTSRRTRRSPLISASGDPTRTRFRKKPGGASCWTAWAAPPSA